MIIIMPPISNHLSFSWKYTDPHTCRVPTILPSCITPRTFHNSMYTLLSFHIYPHSISHLLKWKTTQGCYVQHLHVPRGPESAVCLQPQACESLLELRSYSGYHSVSCSFSRCMCSIKTAFSSWSMGGIGGTVIGTHPFIWSFGH